LALAPGLAQIAAFGMGAWEVPDMGSPMVAFLYARPAPGGMREIYELKVGTDRSDCSSAPTVRIDQAQSPVFSEQRHYWPRFSPNGKRVVFIDDPENAASNA